MTSGDARRLQEHALALNDSVVQGLAAAKMALELGETEKVERLLDETLDKARHIISELLHEVNVDLRPGDLVRGDEGAR
ncbi:MAG: hypothetical protein M3161_02255 [Actinomycetota bacterium]|nr:hypothetical protein [Actinomycetota bacterium]